MDARAVRARPRVPPFLLGLAGARPDVVPRALVRAERLHLQMTVSRYKASRQRDDTLTTGDVKGGGGGDVAP